MTGSVTMLSLRAHVIITAVIVALIVGLAMLGNAIEASGAVPPSHAVRRAAIFTFLGLAVALMFSAVPLMVKLVFGFHAATRNADRAAAGNWAAYERPIVFAMWALLTLGLALAVPAAIFDGAFD